MDSASAHSQTKTLSYQVLVSDDLGGISRVVHVMRQRRHNVTRLSARQDMDGRWLADYLVVATEHEAQLLVQRLNRLPCVLCVRPNPTALPDSSRSQL